MMSDDSKKHRVDFGIITALPEEMEAVMYQLGKHNRYVCDQSGNRTYYKGSLSIGSTKVYDIVITKLISMGNLESAIATNDMIRLWSPRFIIIVGIAGGLNREEQNIGDIVISESIWYYEPSRIVDGDTTRAAPRVIPADPILLDRAKNFQEPSWIDRIPNTCKRPQHIPKVKFGPIASGEKVIASVDFVDALRKMHRKMIAVEMESAGAASAALSSAKQIGFISVRSISDFADTQKNDDWHNYAANSAAAWTFAFLSSCPIRKVEKTVFKPPQDKSMRYVNEIYLFNEIRKRIDLNEFKTFCFILGVDVDDLPGEGKSGKVRELILRFKRRGEIRELASLWQEFESREILGTFTDF